jgi:hypothetical protein
VLCAAAIAGGCAPSLSRGGAPCVGGDKQSCVCPDGKTVGTSSCDAAHGTWGSCQCSADGGVVARCGDFLCNPTTENCTTCPQDCGACPPCDYAPTCTDNAGIPLNPTAESNLNDPGGGPWTGMYGSKGPLNCGPAKLRLRLAKIHANSGNGDEMYCIVQASDGVQSGVAITNKTSGLNDGNDYVFDPSVGVFWGQMAFAVSTNNLTITYNCFDVKNDVWAKVLATAGMVAGTAGSFAGPYGWAFGLGDIGLQAAAAAIGATNGDDNVFNAQQSIDKNELLDMTNGKTWLIDRSGGSCGGFIGIGTHSCDWTLTIESWGCADSVPTPN